MNLIKLLLSLFFFSTLAGAVGGWVSGGGELLKDSHNPWFLNNTTDVYYCIKVDEANFGASNKVIEDNLAKAFSYWKTEFTFALTVELKHFGKVKIASQNFIKTQCADSKVDIRFQFGYLDAVQKKYLRHPNEYAAVTVRTKYESANLKAKGFVYVSPSKGPLAYNQEGVVKDAWMQDNGSRLYITLVHELGHVFGLPHIGAMGALMSEGFVEMMLSSKEFKTSIPFFSLMTKSQVLCLQGQQEVLLNIWKNFFDLDESDKCVQIEFEHTPGNQLFGMSRLKILSGISSEDLTQKIEASLSMYRFNPVLTNLIWLPRTQALFQPSEYVEGTQGVLGISLISVSKKGSFLSEKTKLKRLISVKFEQGKQSVTIEGVDEHGEIITLL